MKPVISIIMGSKSDWATMQKTAEVLDRFGVAYEKKIVSAHRTPDLMFKHAEEARSRGIKVIIAGAGGAAHLPGMVAAKTTLPVIGVPVKKARIRSSSNTRAVVSPTRRVSKYRSGRANKCRNSRELKITSIRLVVCVKI